MTNRISKLYPDLTAAGEEVPVPDEYDLMADHWRRIGDGEGYARAQFQAWLVFLAGVAVGLAVGWRVF
jgi:hypothetical protein